MTGINTKHARDLTLHRLNYDEKSFFVFLRLPLLVRLFYWIAVNTLSQHIKTIELPNLHVQL